MSDIKIYIPSEKSLLAELAATFPGLDAAPLRRTGCEQFGAVFRNCIRMPDGLPIYVLPSDVGHEEPDTHPGYIHRAFAAWLEQRGWYVECYDYGTYFIEPIGYTGQWSNEVWEAYRAALARKILEERGE